MPPVRTTEREGALEGEIQRLKGEMAKVRLHEMKKAGGKGEGGILIQETAKGGVRGFEMMEKRGVGKR